MKYYLAALVLTLAAQGLMASPASQQRSSYYHTAVGHVTSRIPASHRVVKVNHRSYHYHRGVFFDRRPYGYAVVRAPYGARIAELPAGYITLGLGPSRYFYFSGTWYMQRNREYVVVKAPATISTYPASATQSLVVYPALGQADEQVSQDRYECHRWAFEQTGHDPSLSAPSQALRPDYNRASTACLEARGYTVK